LTLDPVCSRLSFSRAPPHRIDLSRYLVYDETILSVDNYVFREPNYH
jgi:hypothetical protein